MPGIGGLISSGVGGLNAASSALQTAGHNISNANTEGYSRQSVAQSARSPAYYGGSFIGTGVQIDNVQRSYDGFLQSQLWSGTANSSAFSMLRQNLDQINNLLSDPSTGLNSAMSDFFNGISLVSNSPANIPERQSLLNQLSVLADRFNSMGNRMFEMEQSINTQLNDHVSVANTLTGQIAEVNQRIFELRGAAAGEPNDLLDQRDQLISKLNAEIGTLTVAQSDGQINVFTGNGQTLVAGGRAYDLTVRSNPFDRNRQEVAIASSGSIISEGITGGALGGLLSFRDNNLDPARNSLGRIALSLADRINTQQRLGLDARGNLGQDLVSTPTIPVYGYQYNGAPSATLSASVSDATALTTADYLVSYDGSNYQVTRSSDNSVVATGPGALSFDGLTMAVSGTANAGDQFTIKPTQRAANGFAVTISDPTKVAAAAPYVSNKDSNAGQAQISAGGTTTTAAAINVGSAYFLQPLRINFTSATTFDLVSGATTISSGNTYAPAGTDITVAYTTPAGSYWKVNISGAAVSGDSFSLSKAGPGDNRNALLLAGIQAQKILDSNSLTLSDAYGQLSTQIGTQGQQAQIGEKAQDNLLLQVKQSQQAISGVNLDEEAANLIRFQQAYQAAGQMIKMANTLFDTILSIR